jgi:hypothetical protein
MANIPASAKRKAVEKVKKTLAKEGIKLKDIKLAKGKAPKKPLKVVNPLTGRKMAKDGPTFKKLIEQGFKFISVKKANRQMIAGVLVPPKNAIESFAKENKVPEENVRQVVATRVANIASGIFGGAPVTAPNREPNQGPNLRQMQNQRNVLAEKPRLNEAERKEMNVLNRNINQVTKLNRVENKLVNVRPRNNEVREAINEVAQTRNNVPVAENKLQTVLGNAEQVVIKANENTLVERNNTNVPTNVKNVAPPVPKTKMNAGPNLANVGNNGLRVGAPNKSIPIKNVLIGAVAAVSPKGNINPIGEKTINNGKEAKNFDKTLGEALTKIVK